MKKSIAVALSLGLIVGAMIAPAEAAKRKKKKPKAPVKVERKVAASYAAPATVVGLCSQTDAVGCMTVMTGAQENYFSAKATDQTGQPVYFRVSADLDGDNSSETTYGNFCGETTEPIKVDPGVELIIWVSPPADQTNPTWRTTCPTGQGFTGALDITLSNIL